MANQYVSMTFHLDPHDLPGQPRSDAELSALYERPEVQAGLVYVTARKDLTLGQTLSIVDALHLDALKFLRETFVVLDPQAIIAAMNAVDELFEIAANSPEALLEPFETRLADGRMQQPYEGTQIMDALRASRIVKHPEYISDDCYFLIDVFSYLKSIRSLMTEAAERGLRVGFVRATDLAEQFDRS